MNNQTPTDQYLGDILPDMGNKYVYKAGQKIVVPDGMVAEVEYKEVVVDPLELLYLFADFDLDNGRKGDLRDIQLKAKFAAGYHRVQQSIDGSAKEDNQRDPSTD